LISPSYVFFTHLLRLKKLQHLIQLSPKNNPVPDLNWHASRQNMAAKPNPIEIAKSLPPTLLRFFARYPPNPLVFNPPRTPPADPPSQSGSSPAAAAEATPPLAPARSTTTTGAIRTQWPNNRHLATWHALKTSPAYNPFLPWRDPSGRWRSPRFGLRRQALLCRLARAHGVESLLPWSPKRADVRAERRERGLRVRGTGVGGAVKGHRHERQLANKLEKRRKAMLGMPALIREWKIVSFDLETGEIANEWIERTWAEVEEVAEEIAALIETLLTNYIITIPLIAFPSPRRSALMQRLHAADCVDFESTKR
jgi:large subunit ribosomal protein L25